MNIQEKWKREEDRTRTKRAEARNDFETLVPVLLLQIMNSNVTAL